MILEIAKWVLRFFLNQQEKNEFLEPTLNFVL